MALKASKSGGRGRGRGNASGADAQQSAQPAANQPATVQNDEVEIISSPSPALPAALSPSAPTQQPHTADPEPILKSSAAVDDELPLSLAEQQSDLQTENTSLLAEVQALKISCADQGAQITALQAQLLAHSQSGGQAAAAEGLDEESMVKSSLQSEELCHRLDELKGEQARAESVRAAAWAELKRCVADISQLAAEPNPLHA